jgi:ribosomal-protein-alanine N-acetyltransferase
MTEDDLPYVLEIEHLSFPNPWHEMTFRGEVQNQRISFPYIVMHKLQRRVIGYIIYWQIREQVQVNTIAVHPDFRRMGIAEAVMRQILDLVQKEGASLVTLEVRPSNFAARSLYHKLGFEVFGIRENYYHRPDEDAIVMGKELSQ